MRAATAVAVLAILPTLVLACGDAKSPFDVAEVTPTPALGEGRLRLNEPITIRFTEPIDPSSVSASSVRVVGTDQRAAAGHLVAASDRVTFYPAPVAAADLLDGGYRPGEHVEVVLAAFPNRDGVLSQSGAALRKAYRAKFDVVSVDDSEASAYAAFVDSRLGAPPRLLNLDRLLGNAGDAQIHPDGSALLVFSKPIAPRTVPFAIELRYDNHDRTPIESESVLTQGDDRAEIRVRPKAGFQRGTRYLLLVKSGRLRDVVGNPIDDVPPLPFRAEETGSLLLGDERASTP